MKILVIPGIGDIHWVALKLRSFLAARGESSADVTVWNFDDRPRSLEFVQRIPFMRAAGYLNEPMGADKPLFNRMYLQGGTDCVKGFRGFDYLLCVNGSLRVGRSMSRILPEHDCEWDYPIRERCDEGAWADRFRADGPYVLLSFSDYGMFRNWVRHLPADRLQAMLDDVRRAYPEHRLVLTGSEWDLPFSRQLKADVDLVGLTDLGKLLALIRRAKAFIGWCGGNTIVSTHLRTPTVMLWCDYFQHRQFQTNWVRPEEGRYMPLNVETLTSDALLRGMDAAIHG